VLRRCWIAAARAGTADTNQRRFIQRNGRNLTDPFVTPTGKAVKRINHIYRDLAPC
jgi:hypothetical protein